MDAISKNHKDHVVASATAEDKLALARALLLQAIAILDSEQQSIAAVHVASALDALEKS